MRIITRFAPSPTGMLHIGGVRTALFNWLYAKKNNGHFLLRIEDTDRQRSTPQSLASIMDGLKWMELEPTDTVFQSKRAHIHREAIKILLAKNTAFLCHMNAEEETKARAKAHAKGHAIRSPWRDKTGNPSQPHRIRMRAPDKGSLTLHDAVQGEVSIAASDIDDLVLTRTDGSPTYMLASVADDHEMGITHIIRGDDHLINAIRQIPIRHALGGPEPVFAHLPLIHGPDGKKLSKRHGATGLDEYRKAGFLPPGLKNYLLLLGWSHGDREFLNMQNMIELFDLPGLGKSPAQLDTGRLTHIHKQHMTQANDKTLLALLLARPALQNLPDPMTRRIKSAIGYLKTRSSTLADLENQLAFLTTSRPVKIPEKLQKKLDEETRQRLTRLAEHLTDMRCWEAASLAKMLKMFCEMEGVSLGQTGPGLRACLTGGLQAPELELVMSWLGQEETLGRIADQT